MKDKREKRKEKKKKSRKHRSVCTFLLYTYLTKTILEALVRMSLLFELFRYNY